MFMFLMAMLLPSNVMPFVYRVFFDGLCSSKVAIADRVGISLLWSSSRGNRSSSVYKLCPVTLPKALYRMDNMLCLKLMVSYSGKGEACTRNNQKDFSLTLPLALSAHYLSEKATLRR